MLYPDLNKQQYLRRKWQINIYEIGFSCCFYALCSWICWTHALWHANIDESFQRPEPAGGSYACLPACPLCPLAFLNSSSSSWSTRNPAICYEYKSSVEGVLSPLDVKTANINTIRSIRINTPQSISIGSVHTRKEISSELISVVRLEFVVLR